MDSLLTRRNPKSLAGFELTAVRGNIYKYTNYCIKTTQNVRVYTTVHYIHYTNLNVYKEISHSYDIVQSINLWSTANLETWFRFVQKSTRYVSAWFTWNLLRRHWSLLYLHSLQHNWYNIRHVAFSKFAILSYSNSKNQPKI